jgi:L-ascorbate metabolism protein UlaG (beta-lactamase superfamily)
MKDVLLTHVGGPTVVLEVAGRRLLTDPTFDPKAADTRPAGHVVAQAVLPWAWPAIALRDGR